MKISKTILAAILGLSMASLCNAGNVYMTGSTAMRGTVYNAMINPGTVFQAAPTVTLYTGGSTGNNAGSGATYMAFSGTLVGGSGTTTIQCHWSGSEAGILDVVSNSVVTETFIDPGLLDGNDHGTNVPTTITVAVNLAMADNAQQFSRTKAPTITKKKEVGVITFKWVRNPGLWNDVNNTNVTDSMIRNALSGGVARALFDGNSAHTDFVYVSGRDNMSGTRVNAFGTSGYGIFTLPKQIELNSSGAMIDLTGGGVYAGNYGFSGGGSLANTLGIDTTGQTDQVNGGTGFSVIAYLGTSDAATAIGKGASELAYNGVPFSPAAIKEGQYTFWGNAYLFEANGTASGSETDKAYGLLAATSGINNFCDGIKAIKLTDMNCSRSGPTSDPSHN